MEGNIEIKKFLNELCSSYNIPNLKIVSKLGTWGEQIRWHVKTNTGTGNFFIKEKPFYLSNSEYIQTLNIQNRLTNVNDLNFPRVIENSKNNLTFTYQSRKFSVQEWIPGSLLIPEQKTDLFEIGKIAAKFQLSINGTPPGVNTVPKCRTTHFPDVSYSAILNMSKILKRVSNNNHEKIIDNLLNSIKNSDSQLSSLPLAWIHGDLHCYNVIRSYQSKYYLIDFDDINWGYRLSDVAWPCIISSAWGWRDSKVVPILAEKLNESAINTVVNGYVKVINLTEIEKQIFPHFLQTFLIMSYINVRGLAYQATKIEEEELISDLEQLLAIMRQIKEMNIYY
ncbi:phosphotransferase enzyme family protein [Metabacillus halosaccharovorans]|uniref:phosphotransferase enzyme family protein n=1 Tax=Metabacillus halosaccharovorans TaxID=930124 RepID=UPI00204235D3|nr:phosphotransferase [Metabacillus halosaccharovorans]MCM3444726.1 phosphotransferase [Metabacillus halosaccharovorans]